MCFLFKFVWEQIETKIERKKGKKPVKQIQLKFPIMASALSSEDILIKYNLFFWWPNYDYVKYVHIKELYPILQKKDKQ